MRIRLRATFDPALPPPATSAYTLRSRLRGLARARHLAGAHGVRQHVDRGLRRRDGAEAERLVEVCTRRVEHADDDALDVEALLRHLGDHEIRVVAVRRDDHGVGLLDPRLAEHVHVHPVADDEAAVPVAAEPAQRLLLLVDRDDVPALAVELERDRRPDSPASDDDHLHGLSVALFYAPAPLPSRTPCGNATMSTSHGAFPQ